jgi:PAS domain S-box-containing protein
MEDADETNEQLTSELVELRQRITRLEASETEHKRLIEVLLEAESRLSSIFSSMTDLVFVLDSRGRFTSYHGTTGELYMPPQRFVGRKYSQVMPPHLNKLIAGALRKNRKGETAEFEYRLEVSGETKYYSARLSPIFLRGEFAGSVAVARDITGRKRAEEERRLMEQKLHLSSRLASIGQMASGIALEINNPLTGVIGSSQLLLQKDIPEDIKRSIETIHDSAQRAVGIINRLLVFARQHKPERAYININEVVETTLALRAYALRTGNIEVTRILVPDLPRTMADAAQLQEVFLNIILNAETGMKLARGRGSLTVKTERVGKTIRISFADDGPGIAGEDLERIFEPFFTTREVGEATGLGLSLCHGIITEHRGQIYAESELGKGTVFIAELPIVAEGDIGLFAKRLGIKRQ